MELLSSCSLIFIYWQTQRRMWFAYSTSLVNNYCSWLEKRQFEKQFNRNSIREQADHRHGCELNKLQWTLIAHHNTEQLGKRPHPLWSTAIYTCSSSTSCQEKGEILNPKSLYHIIGRSFYSTKWLTHLMLQRPHSSAPNLGLQQNNSCWMKDHCSKGGCKIKEIWLRQITKTIKNRHRFNL